MKQATILKNGNVVNTENIIPISFFTSGHLASFKTKDTNIVFHHFINFHNIKDGYYEKEKYLDYKAEIINDKSLIIKFNDWKFATYGDEIIIRKREISYVGQDLISNNKYCWNEYKLIYSDTNYFSEDEINTTVFTINPLKSECNFDSTTQTGAITLTAYNFFMNNIINSNLNDFKLINIIGDITQLINNIDEEIYEAFSSTDFDDSLKQHQKDKWEISLIINPNDYKAVTNYYIGYYNDLKNYYSSVQNYINFINVGSDMVKAIALASSLHPVILQNIDIFKKIEMLSFVVDEFLIVDEFLEQRSAFYDINGKRGYLSEVAIQNFLVNLTYSFGTDDLQIDQDGKTSIDYFLEELLKDKKDGIIFKESITLYELIYKNLNQPFNLTETFYGITNWVLDTNYKPNNTKSAFVYGLYFLWQFSRYNPYKENGEIKPKVIGFNVLDNSSESIAKFTNVNHTLNQECLFYYTNEIGYESYIVVEELTIGENQEFTLYKQKYENASPLVIPYESQKLFGIFNDNFQFSFDGKKIKAIQSKPTDTDYNSNWNSHYTINNSLTYGIYDIYQPVTIVNTNIDTKSPLLTTTNKENEINGNTINSLIPIFVLKYIDDSGDQSDTENMIGFLVDGVLTFSGIGNLSKLRHVRWAALGVTGGEISIFTKQGLRIVFGGVEFTSGVIGFLANFVACLEPSVPDTPENAQVWNNYKFCQNMQAFIMIFELATLSITAGDTIASLAMKNQAARVIENAGGGVDDVTIKNNLINKLEEIDTSGASQQIIENTAENIKDLGKNKYLNISAELLLSINKIYDKIQPKILNRIGKSNGVFSKSFFNQNFNENNFKIIIQDFIQNGINDVKTIEDFVIFACRVDQKVLHPVTKEVVGRIIKGYTFNESRIVINYYTNVILKRGFITGFNSLQDYKLYSQKAKVYLDDFFRNRGISNMTYEVQGSVQFKSHHLDPNVNDVPVLTRDGNIVEPYDFDGRIFLSKHQANNYLKVLERDYRMQLKLENPTWTSKKVNIEVNKILIDVKKGINKGMISKYHIKPDGFLDGLKQAVKRDDGTDIFYPVNSQGISEVGFSIIIKGSPYDVNPVMPLKY